MSDSPEQQTRKYVSRAGLKLEHALHEFKLDVQEKVCADFGCNIGGFTDCLLQHGAARVYAIDTGYGTLAYKLRTDPRVVALERTNVLHTQPPESVDLVVIDVAWTPQKFVIPAALKWIRGEGQISTLVKPHYELSVDEKSSLVRDGRLDPANGQRVFERVLQTLPQLGIELIAHCQSPLTGAKSSRKRHGSGNIEFFVLARPISVPNPQAKFNDSA